MEKLRFEEAISFPESVIPRTDSRMQEFASVLLCKYSTGMGTDISYLYP